MKVKVQGQKVSSISYVSDMDKMCPVLGRAANFTCSAGFTLHSGLECPGCSPHIQSTPQPTARGLCRSRDNMEQTNQIKVSDNTMISID